MSPRWISTLPIYGHKQGPHNPEATRAVCQNFTGTVWKNCAAPPPAGGYPHKGA